MRSDEERTSGLASRLPRAGVDSSTGEDLVLVFIPSLVAILANREKRKGSPLDEVEVNEIRDKSAVIALPRSQAVALEAGRGYEDISPYQCWLEWQEVREALKDVDRDTK